MSTDSSKARVSLIDIRRFIQMAHSSSHIAIQHGVNLDETINAGQNTIASAFSFGHGLNSLFKAWDDLNTDLPDVIAEFMIRRMVVEIHACSNDIAEFKKSVSGFNVATSEAIGKLGRVSQTLHTNLATEQEKIQKLRISLAAIEQKIRDIKNEQSGASGFLMGLETVFTLGFKGVSENLNEQKAQYTLLNQQASQANMTSAQIQKDIDTISQVDQVLHQVTSLDTSIVSLENIIQRLVAVAQKTEHDGDRITTTDNSKVAQFYRNRFNNDMTALLEWKGVFT